MRQTTNIFPDADTRPVSGIPKPLSTTHERGTDYGKPVRETTIANISRNAKHPYLKADRAGKMPKGT